MFPSILATNCRNLVDRATIVFKEAMSMAERIKRGEGACMETMHPESKLKCGQSERIASITLLGVGFKGSRNDTKTHLQQDNQDQQRRHAFAKGEP